MNTVLDAQVDMTVFRKLHAIEYLSSYSHAVRYYTLLELAAFDAWRR